ncbi:MAG TPA: hypothetical protein GXZ90_10085 [Clostridiales bacterium]|nr:hypothetical protein [Clostridiales bacterium]
MVIRIKRTIVLLLILSASALFIYLLADSINSKIPEIFDATFIHNININGAII